MLLQTNPNKIHFSLRILLISIFVSASFAQAPDTIWTRTYGGSNIDIGTFVSETTDGGFIITGYTRSYGAMSGRNVLLIKTDQTGNPLWINGYGGNNDEEANAVVQTSDGGFVASGYTKSFGAGGNDFYLIKVDSNGIQVWERMFGGTSDEEVYSMIITDDGGFLLAGATSSFGAGSRDIWLVKTDAFGNQQWTKTIGGLSSDGARSISKTSDGGYIITGWTFSYGPGAVGNVWLVKTDASGNMIWNKFFGGTDVERGLSVKQINDGGYIITGYTASSGAGLDDMLLIKTDSLGNAEWQHTFGGSGRDYGNSVIQTSDGGFVVTGYTLSFGAGGDDLWIVKTDAQGNLLWNKTLGGAQSDVGYCIKEISDGSLIVAGHTLSFGAGLHDVWLINLASVIPVELVSFNAKVTGNSVELNWTTASETNNRGFEIHRSFLQSGSQNLSWEIVSFVNGKGTSSDLTTYKFVDKNPGPGKYFYRLKQIDFDGNSKYSNPVEVEIISPKEFILEQNYPNPFNPTTEIIYVIPEGVENVVILKVYDVLGNVVTTLVNEKKQPGIHKVKFSAVQKNNSELTGGVYFYQLKVGNYIITKKMMLLK
ncbi:PKD repeat protein [Ignavibacterium album JCM 16511]|uniref:PKD repeat protein n=1 Tax=Ignavibacterium album (strain DSM 19864 / JCM 16511 / NBRC 101810 / Mat9-16) TaxID=945713 RepID=I0AKX5_IGNAJ|nr:T9SS type A sorting domain-containing protein [Ignavibacterium album]AFH49632.1 PKD repeat protein [Ignavibacterium album JCM 16511]